MWWRCAIFEMVLKMELIGLVFVEELNQTGAWVMWPKQVNYGISIGIWALTSKDGKCAIKTVSSDALAHAEAFMYMSNEQWACLWNICIFFLNHSTFPARKHNKVFCLATGVKVAVEPEFWEEKTNSME